MSCCADLACSHAVMAAATVEATQLTDKEREIILGVLGRDERLRRDQQIRVMHLKAELQNLRRKGALRASADFDSTSPDPDRTCGRCRTELGRVINRGAYCRACRLKVCKGCREYSFRTTDWVCTVCHKHMEIQAASGEWMNEFVRRPSRRRDNRVYVPAADIIKRTIRRSWTISNPTPRWTSIRGSPELRPYNSLPRGQDINNYPSLALHQSNLKNQQLSTDMPSPPYRRKSPTRRTQSEDVYGERSLSVERGQSPLQPSPSPRSVSPGYLSNISPVASTNLTSSVGSDNSSAFPIFERPVRVNPLMVLAESRQKEKKISPKMKKKDNTLGENSPVEETGEKNKPGLSPEPTLKLDKSIEKRVSFDSNITNRLIPEKSVSVLRTQSLTENRHGKERHPIFVNRSFGGEDHIDDTSVTQEVQSAKEDSGPVELCDIEPLSGTVFRKVTVRRRAEKIRKVPAVDAGLDFLLPEGDDYKLVFISSDSSSKEEDIDDNDSSSTASSFPIDECDWDYFEPGAGTGSGTKHHSTLLSWNSPFGSPRVYRRSIIESPLGSPIVYRRRRTRESDTGTDEDTTRFDSGSPASSDSLFHARISSEEPLDQLRPIEKCTEEQTAALQCLHSEENQQKAACQSCGASTQYIPIPIPVPVPFPVPAVWTGQDGITLYGSQNLDQTISNSRLRVLPRSLWPYIGQAALILPLINTNAGEQFSTPHSVLHNNKSECEASTTMPVAVDRDNSQRETACSSKTDAEQVSEDNKEDEAVAADVIEANEEITGYLECENRYVSSSDFSRDSSDSGDTSGDQKPKIRRVYIVNGGESRQSDDALPSSNVTSDEEGRNSHSSVREDDMSSSGSADTDSDDTGTVADQKPKRFSRIFVVNKNLSSSSHESTGSSDSDTSDNDTDTEMDCTVILTNIKSLDDENCTTGVLEDGDKINDTINQVCDKQSGDNISEELDNIVSTDKVNKEREAKESEYMSSSPGLSDVSAESLNSSDVDQVRNYANNNEVGKRFTEVLQKELCKVNSNKINKNNDSLGKKRKELYLTKELLSNEELLKRENQEYKTVKEKSSIIDNTDEQKCNDNIQGNNKIDIKSLPVIENLNIKDGRKFHSESDLQKISAVSLEKVLREPRLSRNVSPIQTCSDNTAVSLETVLSANKKSATFTERAKQDNNEEKAINTLGDNAKNIDHNGGGIPKSQESLNKNLYEKVENETERTDNVAVEVDSEFLSETSSKAVDPEPGEWNQIRSSGEGRAANTRERQPGGPAVVSSENLARHAARYTSLVMITQDPAPNYQQVSVVTSDTTTLVQDNEVIVHHTNWQDQGNNRIAGKLHNDNHQHNGESVTVITGGETLSAFEEGLADDDSWVENLSYHDDDDDDDDDDFGTNSPTDDSSSGEEVTLTCSSAIDQEDELRGYHRSAIDFTLHTIVEESCEESEVEQNATKKKERPASATDLEKYFFFGLGDGTVPSSINSNREDGFSETSSIYSEGMESLGGPEDNSQLNDNNEPAELASSRLEKYFLSGFMGFTAERRDSDGSVGSDSEGRPSPEQRRKRLVRARGTGRSHSSSLDNLDNAGNEQITETQMNSEDSSSSDSETYDDINSFEKPDGQFDTVKRKKGKKKAITVSSEEIRNLETPQEIDENDNESDDDEDGHKTPQPEIVPALTNLTSNKNQQSRDSGFIGSCDDLLKEQRDNITPELPLGKSDLRIELEDITEEKKVDEKITNLSTPPATTLTRKDSFNNWSSDEETNLMMCKMRQFFKTMVANSQCNNNSKPGTPNMSSRMSPKPLASPRMKSRCKPPQLVYFENELTRLMKTVPGIRDDQVREIVEYLSSEDTWSDSYDSSDYTSSDLEGAGTKTALQQQISDSCKQIISKFDNSIDDEGDEGDGGIIDESHGINKETAFVYQKLVASFEKMATGDSCASVSKLTPHNSPPLIAKVMHHIGSRLVALMHEVSSGESHASNSPKTKHYHRRLQHKISSASSTTTEDDGPDIGNHDTLGGFEETSYNLLPRSRSHDLLVGETRTLNQSSGGVSDITEEREASDCERFSWRGSFESALLATDSRNKLSLLGGEASASASAIAAKRRSAGDLLFSHKSLSREQLDRVRSCGSIGGGNSEDKLWVASATRPNKRRSSVPDASCGSGGSADGEDEDEEIETRSTLPRSLQTGAQTTNSLPRLPTNTASSMQKSQSMYHFLPQNVKSARYRPPGLSRLTSVPKRAVSAPGLQPSHQRRGRRSQQQNVPSDDVALSEAHSSPMLATRSSSKSATPSPVAPSSRRNTGSVSSQEWQPDDDIDRLVGFHGRSSLSSLGLRSDSMASVYSGAGEGRYGSVAVRGQVEFGLQYNYKAGALEIMIKQCRDLAPVDAKRNRSDPYVKVYLLPDKSKSGKRKTKVKKHTLNPVFDECLKFHISLNGLEMRTLWLTVWHSDMFGRNDFLGEVMMALENKVFDDPTPMWYNLQERTEPFEDFQSYKGDIIVCLKFVPPDMTMHKKGKRSRGALHVLVKEAKSLTAVKANGTSDPFCKSYLLPDKGRSSKQKTPVARRTINPVWNYTFVYDDVTLQELAERCLELTVWDHDRLASNEFLGGVRFSLGTGKHYGKPVEWMDATGKEHSLWKSMLERPNFWVEGCVSLRPTLDTRTL